MKQQQELSDEMREAVLHLDREHHTHHIAGALFVAFQSLVSEGMDCHEAMRITAETFRQ